MAQKLGWGVVGTGRRAQEVMIPALLASHSSRLVGVCGRTEERARESVSSWPDLQVFGCFDEMLADPEVSVVYISTPHFLHVPEAVQSIEKGKHVFMESPLALSVDGAHKIIEKARAAGVKLGVAMQHRFHPGMAEVKELVKSGRIGPVRFVEVTLTEPFEPASAWWRDATRSGPASLVRSGVMGLDLASWLAAEPVAEIMAMGRELGDPPLNVMGSMMVRFADDAQAFVMTASHLPEFQHRLRVDGDGGRIVLKGDFNGGEVTTLTVTSQDRSETKEFEPDDAVGAMIDGFARSVGEGVEFQPTGSEGKLIVEAVCAAIESMKSRRSVRVGDVQRPG